MKLELEIGDKVIVTLKERSFFDSYDSNSEVRLRSKSDMEEILGLSGPMPSEKYKKNKFREHSILRIKEFEGVYVGNDSKTLRVRPLYGLENPDAQHFVIPLDQIRVINKYISNPVYTSMSVIKE